MLTMLLLSKANYPVVTELQGIFSPNFGDVMLMPCARRSRCTCVSSFLNIHSEQKVRTLSVSSKILLAL